MIGAVAILGQSNATNLRDVAVAGVTPAPDTFTLDPTTGLWVPPANSVAVFANELRAKTGRPVYVIMGAVGGSTLISDVIASNGHSVGG